MTSTSRRVPYPASAWVAALGIAIGSAGCSLGGCEDCPVYYQTALAFDGSRYLVATSTLGRLEGAVVTPDLVVRERWGIDLPRGGWVYTATHGAEQFLVLWRTIAGPGALGGFFDPVRRTRDAPLRPIDLAPVSLPDSVDAASLAFDGANFVVGWVVEPNGDYGDFQDAGVRAARISPGGTILDPGDGILVLPGMEGRPATGHANGAPVIASSGGESLIVWGQQAPSGTVPPRVLAARLSRGGALQDPGVFVVAEGRAQPAVAWDGRDYVVTVLDGLTWGAEIRAGASLAVTLRGRRVSPQGRVGAETFAIPAQWPVMTVRTAVQGDVMLVAWTQGTEVRAARARDGAMLSPGPVTLGSGFGPSVGPHPAGFVVAWTDTRDASPDHSPVDDSRVWMRTVAFDGTLGAPVSVFP